MKKKTVIIEIEKEDILHAIKLQAYRSGEASKEKDQQRIAASSQASNDDDDLLTQYIENGFSRVIDVINGILEGYEYDDDNNKYAITLSVPELFDMNQEGLIKQAIKSYLAYWSLFMWYSTTWPEKSIIWNELSEQELLKINHRSLQRNGPVRRPHEPLC